VCGFSDVSLSEKLASSTDPRDSTLAAPKEVSRINKETLLLDQNAAEGKGVDQDINVVQRSRKLELTLEKVGLSEKAVSIISSIRQSSSSSKLEPSGGSNKPSRFDNCKEFLRRSDAPTTFDASTTSKSIYKFPTSKSISSLSSVLKESKGSLTEVHSGTVSGKNNRHSVCVGAGDETIIEDEVEIVSLLEEQVPRYKLRADTLTKFGGEIHFE